MLAVTLITKLCVRDHGIQASVILYPSNQLRQGVRLRTQ